ncbi:3-hydroxyacyl-CoA dehydrogenase NAD-binding domain-containing protein [Spongiibacter taiwanensis]|uniref:3-hydroxyacyl-CoA dehydrogenase NAD-binding domain-containing protein n=1 Tax=Spongiibacter taiwanensis TaxID=1748242 RepID=UPI00203599F1|nr:3-hydroxyacyl-CoA dehydrogenase NAD-binding domain-containing protein [Spongiibacter taiwanensis]USA42627.1 3-hydroxyacyl-CoA dehydrogenase NAD-binding domain-containing protein [Spongiibacter taiwanensis]
MTANTGFTYQVDSDGIALVTMDMPGQAVNIMNSDYLHYMDQTLAAIRADLGRLKGVVLASAKSTFFAGGDIKTIMQSKRDQDWDAAFAMNLRIKAQLAELETLGIPVVAAINGAAMGGGFEICLACHHRIALDSKAVAIQLPEVNLGLLPGAGGVVRTVRLLGIQKAFPVLIEAKKYSASAALEAGLIHETASSPEDMLAKAKAYILANPEACQPWLAKGYRIPGGDMYHGANGMMLAGAPAMIQSKTRGLLPAPETILKVMAESSNVGYEAAMKIEGRYFAELLRSPESTALISTLYFQMNEIAAGASRPTAIAHKQIAKVGVLGAGMMGRGIAYSTALSGTAVVLKDVSIENAEKGKDYSRKLLAKQVEKGRKSQEQADQILALIQTTADNQDLSDCDLIIEAVFEDIELKHKLTREIEPFLKPTCVWGSNTSTLPIGLLAEAFSDPSRFIGVHFFSPVDKMPLVEIIRAEHSSDDTLALVYDYTRQIRKSPIVVNDARGFYTSRVFGCYGDEALHLLTEGVKPILIENMGKFAGMPVGPLAIMDEVEIELMRKVGETNKALDERLGDDFHSVHSKLQDLSGEMCRMGRTGRGCGKGYYDYFADGSKVLWPGLKDKFGGETEMPLEDIRDRLMFRQVVEALDCIHRGVVRSARDANIGSLFGWGFPTHTGGAFHFIEWFGGEQAFSQRAAELASKYGSRFALPASIADIKSMMVS